MNSRPMDGSFLFLKLRYLRNTNQEERKDYEKDLCIIYYFSFTAYRLQQPKD